MEAFTRLCGISHSAYGRTPVNGANRLVNTLVKNGVEVCFANPGTSEMHFVSAVENVPELRCVLAMFEGVVTGAADGYARVARKPAATLLHLGPGLANGMSNLHNALRADSPIVNIIGDHATYHRQYDAPLTSDIEGAARPFSDWVRTSPTADSIATDTAAAIAASQTMPGQIASLILPADTAWTEPQVDAPLPDAVVPRPQPVDQSKVKAVAEILTRAKERGEGAGLILSRNVTDPESLEIAGRIAKATGARLLLLNMTGVASHGAGRVAVERIPYAVNDAVEFLADFQNLVLVGTKVPVSFFAYPDKPSEQFAQGTLIQELATSVSDQRGALEALAAELGATDLEPDLPELKLPEPPTTGAITPRSVAELVVNRMPENSVLIDESITSGGWYWPLAATARPHEYLSGTGGSIGYAMPVAVGAAIAAPESQVITLESDGSGMYQLQALWTQARENLNIVTLIFSNNKYQILRNEMANVGATFGERSERLLDLSDPNLDWVKLAGGMGVHAERATTMEELTAALDTALATDGPALIEVDL
nr:acetolactate synthase large subunit [Brevibacterium sp. 91QC2O2]